MSVEKIFGGWDTPPSQGANDDLVNLFHCLAAQNVSTPHQQLNSGLSQRKHEIIQLWELYRRAKPKIVVEIGVAQGGTFASWCFLGVPDATLIGADRDVNDCRPRSGEQVSPRIVHRTVNQMTVNGGGMYALGRNNQKVIPINGWTTDPATRNALESALSGKKIDWLFHDASHDALTFSQDFAWLWPLIADGGVFAVHDIMPSLHPDVTKDREWQRIKREEDYSACFEFRGSRGDDSLGIGVLVK